MTSQHQPYHKISDGLYCIDSDYTAPEVAALYLLVDSGDAALIDAGTVHSLANIETCLSDLGLSYDNVKYVIPTHIHLDHAAGAGHLMQRCQHAQCYVHPRGAYHLSSPEKLVKGTQAVYGEAAFAALYGEILPIDEARISTPDDGETITLGTRPLQFIHTPGHALHHFCIYDATSEGIFTGDNFGVSYPILNEGLDAPFIFPTTTPVHFDPEAMVESLRKLVAREPQYAYLTHFGRIDFNEANVTQFLAHLKYFVETAQSLYKSDQDLAKSLPLALSIYLSQQLKERGSPLSQDQRMRSLENDIRLNCQGIIVWIERLTQSNT